MNCRDFLNEFETRNALSEAATRHLKDCADCRKVDIAQTRVWQLIDKFEPVAAPNDFDFHVKARIAQAKPAGFQSMSFPVLRNVLGLSVAGLILAFVVFNGVYSLDDKIVPQVAETNFQPSAKIVDVTAKPSAPGQVSASVSQSIEPEKSLAVSSKSKIESVENKKRFDASKDAAQLIASKSVKNHSENGNNAEKNFDGHQDSTLSTARVITPKGIPNSAQPNTKSTNFESASSITVEQVLSLLGIETILKSGKLEVKAVKQNSVGEHSGVKVGDTIDAIDGEKLTDKSLQSKTVGGKKMTILRGAESLEISLHN